MPFCFFYLKTRLFCPELEDNDTYDGNLGICEYQPFENRTPKFGIQMAFEYRRFDIKPTIRKPDHSLTGRQKVRISNDSGFRMSGIRILTVVWNIGWKKNTVYSTLDVECKVWILNPDRSRIQMVKISWMLNGPVECHLKAKQKCPIFERFCFQRVPLWYNTKLSGFLKFFYASSDADRQKWKLNWKS